MDGRFNNPFISEQEDPATRTTSDHGNSNSTSTTTVSSSSLTSSLPKFSANNIRVHNHDSKQIMSTTLPSPKKSRRAVQKRVVSIPIAETDGSRLKGEGAPPSDSWAWRKYGQKPIKGSPYPRGYYRCSSSKGCPARKQVERSRVDPTMLVITYACDHNHAWPASRNSNSNNNANSPSSSPSTPTAKTTTTTTTSPTTTAAAAATATTNPIDTQPEESAVFANQPDIETEDKFDLCDDSMITTDDFGWFSDVASTSHTMLESPICAGSNISNLGAADMAMIFPMGEEDESLFADLGELPECSVVFRRGYFEQEEERRRCSLRTAPWCGSTG